jgi:hypothetical protein
MAIEGVDPISPTYFGIIKKIKEENIEKVKLKFGEKHVLKVIEICC